MYDHCGLLPDFLRVLRRHAATAESFDDIVDAAEEHVALLLPSYRTWPSILLVVVDHGDGHQGAERFAIVPMLWGVRRTGLDEGAREACAFVASSLPGVVGLILLGRVTEELDPYGWRTEGLVFLAISGNGAAPRHWASESVSDGPLDESVVGLDGRATFADLLRSVRPLEQAR